MVSEIIVVIVYNIFVYTDFLPIISLTSKSIYATYGFGAGILFLLMVNNHRYSPYINEIQDSNLVQLENNIYHYNISIQYSVLYNLSVRATNCAGATTFEQVIGMSEPCL